MLRYTFIAVFAVFTFIGNTQAKNTPQQYVEMYKDYAINAMHEVGIPASITLAQGILESGSGNSILATKGNNHFGIKCHKSWTGERIYYDDDKKDDCFRVYENAGESFMDHSKFLTTRGRYAFLFDLDPLDYKAWAKGLKKAGYATDPSYAHRLINLIEKYNLAVYDNMPALAIVEEKKEEREEITVPVKENLKSDDIEFTFHDIKTIRYSSAYSIREIAEMHGIGYKRLMKWNDMPKPEQLQAGMQIFLQPKRRAGNTRYHNVVDGETMFLISQMHGIQMKMLYKRNLMEYGTEAAVGERLNLKGKRKTTPRLAGSKSENLETHLRRELRYHRVKSTDSLTSIARLYGYTMQELKSMNQMESARLTTGQQIVVGFAN